MEKIRDRINLSFQNLFNDKEHPFFQDLIQVEKLSKNYIHHMKEYTTQSIPYEANSNPKFTEFETPAYKVLSKKKLEELMKEMNVVLNWKKILKLVSFMSQYMLESTVKNENKLYQIIKKAETLNIMIIGSGPIGLYLACYLSLYYNRSGMNPTKKVNVVIYDNRIERAGFRKPYTRQRPFATSSQYLNLVIPKLYCWNQANKDNSIFVNIFMLEYILYTLAVTTYSIPIIYRDYSWDEYKKIIEKGNFKVVFDCTGGRLKNNAIKNIDSGWLDKMKHFNNSINKKLIISRDRNIVEVDTNKTTKKFIKNHYYGSISIHLNDTINTFVNKYDIDIVTNCDLLYLNTLKNKCFTYIDFIDVIKGIKDNVARNFLYSIMTTKKSSYHEMRMMVDVFSIYIRHAIKICDIVEIKRHRVLYIGAGDTIFHSHFITGSGLNRTIDFTVKCANLLEELHLCTFKTPIYL